MKKIALITLLLMSFQTTLSARSLKGVNFEDKIELSGKPLVLNGLGLRLATKFFMKFKVYVAALYLENKNTNASEIILNDEYKKLELHFLRDISGKKISNAYKEGLKANKTNIKLFQTEVDLLINKVEDMKDGGKIIFEFLGDKVKVKHGSIKYQITNKAFLPHILKLWLAKAPNPEVKQGILGLK